MTEKKKYCAYLRVSTQKQKKNRTIENQRLTIERWLSSNPNIIIKDWFIDDGISAFSEKRSEYIKLRQALELNLYDGLVIAKLSRIARSLRELLEIRDYFEKKELDLIIIKDKLDNTTPQGRLQFSIFGAFMEFEKDLILERTAEGRMRALDNGVKFGRPRKETNDLQIIKMYQEQQLGTHRIAKILNISQSTVLNRLKENNIQMRKIKGKKDETKS